MDPKLYNTGSLKRPIQYSRPNHITLHGSFEPKKIKFNNHSTMKQNNNDVANLENQRKALPIFQARQELISQITKNNTLIIIGETGSGKTTQLPQYIFENKLHDNGIIGITQPRRVAATTLSSRVALEAKTTVGDLVGYSIRFEDVTSNHTKIKFLTDGMLLREAIFDEKLMAYNFIILDEAHERTVHTDVLFGIVKKAQATRQNKNLKRLKVIIMSATMDVDHFSKYFNSAPVIYLEGRQHNVEIMHAIQPQEDYLFSSIVTVFQIHKEAPANEDILVFLTGQEEIESMTASIRSIAKQLGAPHPSIKVFPLYSALQASQMQQVFRPTPNGCRKIVISTNVAETSVTIPGIKYVVDSGKVKAKVYQPSSGLDSLKVENISQAQAWQRAGRAGRERPGLCYRIYTQPEFAQMARHIQPEILRCNLSTVTLQLLALGINTVDFDFIDKPSKESLTGALRELQALDAIDSIENPTLTAMGQKMAKFPIDPRYSKIILSSDSYGCGEEIISIIALLSGESILLSPQPKREEAKEAQRKFSSSTGDHITMLQMFRKFRNVTQSSNWCHENYLNHRNLQYAVNVRKQLGEICRSIGLQLTSCGQEFDQVRKCLVTGLFMNVAQLEREKQYFTVGTRQRVWLHPSSVLSDSLPPYILFSELTQTSKCYIRTLSIVDPDWLVEIAPQYFRQHRLTGLTTAS